MSEEIIKVLDNLGQKFGIAIDWSNQNVLPYVQDLIHRGALNSIVGSIIGLVIGIIFLAIGIGILIYGIKQTKKDKYWEWMDEGIVSFLAMLLLFTVAFIIISVCICTLTQAIYLPEITFLNYIR